MNHIFTFLMTVCFVMCNIPQIIQILKTKSTKDISTASCVLILMGNIFAFLSSYTTQNIPVSFLVSNVIFTILSGINLFLCIKYK